MRIIKDDITDITRGIIIHQVNCQGVMGAGVAKALRAKYPVIFDEYTKILSNKGANAVFGKFQHVHITDELIVVNAFTQFDYGNPRRTNLIYTDVDALITVIKTVCNTRHSFSNHNLPVYIPYGIGAGFGGADWNDITSKLIDVDVIAVKLN